MKLLTPLLLAVAVISAVATTHAADARPAPNITVAAEDESSVRLDAFKGKVLLVDFWASWCVPCRTSFPALEALLRTYEPRGLQVLAVNLDERRRDADAFLREYRHALPVFFDPLGEAPKAFGVKGMPSSFIVDREGKIRFEHMGYSANIGQLYRQEIDLLLSERPRS